MNRRIFLARDALHTVSRVESFSQQDVGDELLMVSERDTYPNATSIFLHSDEELPSRSKGLLETQVWGVDANYVVRMPRGTVCRGVIPISREGVVYHDIAVHAGRHQRPGFVVMGDNGALEARVLWKEPEVHRGSAALLFFSGACGLNHSHWLIHAVPKIGIFQRANVRPDYYLVTESIQAYQRETLYALGIRPEQIVVVSDHTPIQFDELYVAYTNNPLLPDLSVYDEIIAAVGTPSDSPELVYVPRLDARRMRRFLNEREVISVAQKLGFHIVDTTKLSFKEEMQVFINARVIAGALGAGLCNSLFMKPGGLVIAMSDPEYVMDWQQQIASLRQHSIIHLLGNSFLSMEPVHVGTHNSWCLDPSIFEETVRRYVSL